MAVQPRIHKCNDIPGWPFRLAGAYEVKVGHIQSYILVCNDRYGQFFCPVWEIAFRTATKAMRETRGPYAVFVRNREGFPLLKIISHDEARELLKKTSPSDENKQ